MVVRLTNRPATTLPTFPLSSPDLVSGPTENMVATLGKIGLVTSA